MRNNKRERDLPVQTSPERQVYSRSDSSVSLRLESGSATFVCGTEELPVPPHLAQHSELIADLLGEVDGCQKDLPIPVSLSEARAWLELADVSSSTETTTAAPMVHESAEAKDESILQALKVGIVCLVFAVTVLFCASLDRWKHQSLAAKPKL